MTGPPADPARRPTLSDPADKRFIARMGAILAAYLVGSVALLLLLSRIGH